MKSLLCFVAVLFSLSGWAQINGNKNVTTLRFPADGLEELWINLNIDIEVITTGDESYIEVTTDENIIPYINLETRNGKLELDQKKWIESSGTFKVKIVAPDLKAINNDSWVDLSVQLSGQEKFIVRSTISEITVNGDVNLIEVETENSEINLTDLKFQSIESSVLGNGKIIVTESKQLNKNGATTLREIELKKQLPIFANARFIDLRIKNNRNQSFSAYVKGPKKDGSYFSYGLNFYRNQIKKERWSVGTKLYKVNRKGHKSEIYTVKPEDEGKIVDLWN